MHIKDWCIDDAVVDLKLTKTIDYGKWFVAFTQLLTLDYIIIFIVIARTGIW